jgi:predicted alpha/beta hydrolase
MASRMIDTTLTAADGALLGASRFDPDGPPARAVVIAGAMGVPQRFYAPLARALTERGIAVLTFDYRGIGRSLRPPLRAEPARLCDWGEQDLDTALRAAREAWPDAPLAIFGHSVGGQLSGMAATFPQVDRMLTIASQSGYWRLWPGIGAAAMWSVWHVGIPVMTTLFGYLPFRTIGMGENVPRDVARDWARSGRCPGYLWDFYRDRPSIAGYGAWRGALRAIDISDDPFAPRATVDAFATRFPNASVERVTVTPESLGRRKIAHFGAFRETVRETLWRECADWLIAPTRQEA